jgi:phytoene/squalene synthetase
MENQSSNRDLASSITKSSSKQTYIIANLLVDNGLVGDCHRAYAYFRWLDDHLDEGNRPTDECFEFINRQKRLKDSLYRGEVLADISAEEGMLVELLNNGGKENPLLRSYIDNFLNILEFDVKRRGRLISEEELSWYSRSVGKAVTDAILHFIGNGHSYPADKNRYLAAEASHITHMLRDFMEDLPTGYVNITKEYLDIHAISHLDVESEEFRSWVKQRVQLARRYFREGKSYIDSLPVFRSKLAARLYCARFECILDEIERDGYRLRPSYDCQRNLSAWFRMGVLAMRVTSGHIIQKVKGNA